MNPRRYRRRQPRPASLARAHRQERATILRNWFNLMMEHQDD